MTMDSVKLALGVRKMDDSYVGHHLVHGSFQEQHGVLKDSHKIWNVQLYFIDCLLCAWLAIIRVPVKLKIEFLPQKSIQFH